MITWSYISVITSDANNITDVMFLQVFYQNVWDIPYVFYNAFQWILRVCCFQAFSVNINVVMFS